MTTVIFSKTTQPLKKKYQPKIPVQYDMMSISRATHEQKCLWLLDIYLRCIISDGAPAFRVGVVEALTQDKFTYAKLNVALNPNLFGLIQDPDLTTKVKYYTDKTDPIFYTGVTGFGMSKCGPDDVYDQLVGYKLARNRAIINALKKLRTIQMDTYLRSVIFYNFKYRD